MGEEEWDTKDEEKPKQRMPRGIARGLKNSTEEEGDKAKNDKEGIRLKDLQLEYPTYKNKGRQDFQDDPKDFAENIMFAIIKQEIKREPTLLGSFHSSLWLIWREGVVRGVPEGRLDLRTAPRRAPSEQQEGTSSAPTRGVQQQEHTINPTGSTLEMGAPRIGTSKGPNIQLGETISASQLMQMMVQQQAAAKADMMRMVEVQQQFLQQQLQQQQAMYQQQQQQ
ncbi:uncharacterized protein LOC120104125 [Phoenix dactylifera]|uniref:Uncharacterized protein LOC120104125 n=1 Tax=Phoenix dactylifera TaxID=42345 RepID=A0A8B8ZGL8_PHODC|nr:uncharacterized protein LOC120104125 [Phoenix dactylifera]